VSTRARQSLPRPSVGDVVAGVSVALVLIPQSLAYAEIAGVPPHVGLLAAGLPPLLAAPFTSSPYLQTGPVALTSLLTFGALSGLATAGSPDYVALAALLAVIVGVTRVALGLLRMGTIAYLMSQPVVMGFTTGAAILIVSSQVPSMFGVTPETEGTLQRAWWTLVHPGDWQSAALWLSAATIALVIGSRSVHRLFPGVLIVVIGTTAWSRLADYSGATLGDLPGGFLSLSLDLPFGEWTSLIVPGIVIAVVGFAEPAAICRTFAAQDRIPWNANKEFVGNGIANLASAVSGGFPVGGSFARSSLSRIAGATSIWTGAISGVIVLAALPFAPNLEPLPRAVLGAIVLTAVAKLIQPIPIMRMWPKSAPQAAIASGTFVATLVTSPNVERGIIIGVVLSIGFHLYREMRIDYRYEREGDRVIVRPSGVVWFASTPALEDAFRSALAEHHDVDRVTIDLASCGRLDYTGASALAAEVTELAGSGYEVDFVNIPDHAQRALAGALGGAHNVPTLDELPAATRYQWVAPWRRVGPAGDVNSKR
jgi:SulP family sulfate permease